MNIKEKEEIVDFLTEKFSSNNCFYIIDSSGLSVPDVDKLRRTCFNQNVTYKVAKNTLIVRALSKFFTPGTENNLSTIEASSLHGFSGILFAKDALNVPAKIIENFKKESNNEKPLLKCACVDGELFIGNDKLKELSNLKSKNELIGDIILLLQSPVKNVVSGLESGKDKLARILETLSKK